MSNLGTILIVEDDMDMVNLLSAILEEEGYEIFHALGKEALNLAERLQPDLLLLDVMMPQMDGLEWSSCAKANSNTRDIPIIILTAAGAPLLKSNYKSLQANSYLPKPFDIEQLLHLTYAFCKAHNTVSIPSFSYN